MAAVGLVPVTLQGTASAGNSLACRTLPFRHWGTQLALQGAHVAGEGTK